MNYNRKKIAFVIPSLGMGGAERVASELANEFVGNGIDVSFILLDKNEICYELNKKIKIYFVEYDKNKNTFFRNLERIKKINEIIRNNSIEFILSFLTSANFLTLLSTHKTHTKKYISERSDPNRASKKTRFIRNILYRFADGCIFQTEDARKCFSKKIQRKSIVIKNPVKSDLPKWIEVEHHDNIIATACRLEKSKNIPMLIDAFSKVVSIYNDYKLIIYGEGNEYDTIKEKINKMNLDKNIILNGRNGQWHKQAIHSKLFVLSSDYEGMSNSLIEAMAMGMPVISTDHPIGGARAIINDGENGFLIPINNSNALYNKIIQIIEDEKLQLRFSKEAIKIKQELNIQEISNQWLNYITNESEK